MKVWDGNGPTPAFTLSDDEVLALMSASTMNVDPGDPRLVPAITVWRKLQQRAEDILNEQRAANRVPVSPESEREWWHR